MRSLLFATLLAAAAVVAWLVLRADRPPPSVLLITIDTLRADALTEEDTPALRELGGRGTRFSKVRTPVPLTLPAHATILSGLLPAGHGIRDNSSSPLSPGKTRGFPLLAEEFRERGYATAAFVAASVLGARYGLDAGFASYGQPAAPGKGDPRFRSLDATEQVERARVWLEGRPKDRPFFAWVHLWEPHDPYRLYAGDERREGTAEQDSLPARYRGEVRKADAAVEALLALIDPETTIVLVTSDHGESLSEHDEATHGHLCYGATMDVPLVLAGPGVPRGPAGGEERLCSLTDVAPTLRDLCGLRARPGDGRSLLATGAGPGRVVVGESLFAYRLYRWAQQSAATDGRFSLVDGGPRWGLFDLRSDPQEASPLPDPESHVAYERLDRALVAYRARAAPRRGGAASGAGGPYGSVRVAGSDGFLRPEENRRLCDVRRWLKRLPPLFSMRAAVAARDRGVARRLLPAMEKLAADDPTNPAPCLAAGRALLLVLLDGPAALVWLEEARRRGYGGIEGLIEAARGPARK